MNSQYEPHEQKENIMVSIICNAYNHEDYIEDALKSFLMQKTDFAYEILIHDDASTDKTADIIRKYESKYPNIIKPIYQTENQYSKDNSSVSWIQYERVKGKYIALCEGDDYWTDPLKLQKQVDALEAHPEIDICAHGAVKVNAKTKEAIDYVMPKSEKTVIPIEEIISGGGGYIMTSSLIFRSSLNNNIPEFRKKMQVDYSVQIHGSLRGGMLYLNECMSVYRYLTKGSWSQRVEQNAKRLLPHLARLCEMLQILDKETQNQYSKTIQAVILKHNFESALLKDEFSKLTKEPFVAIYKKLSLKEKIKIRLKQYFPCLLKIKRKIRKI